MNRIGIALVLLASAAVAGGPKGKRSVAFAPSWEAAVQEARALNLPIVVHSHGFYCPPCWGMHKTVLQGKKYVAFATENTVEVIVVSQFEEGCAAADGKACTYKAEGADGQTVEYLVEWPGLTAAQLRELNRSKAATYNQTGGVPHTAIVDPHTLEKLEEFAGSTSAKSLMGAVADQRKALEKQHGKSVSRKVLTRMKDKAAQVSELVEKGELARALAACGELKQSVAKHPDAIRNIADAAAAGVYAAAGRKLDELEAEMSRGGAKGAVRELGPLARAVKGTPLEERAKSMLERARSQGA